MSGFRFIKHIFIVLMIVIVFGFMAVVYKGAAEGKPSTLSGRVVGTNGEPIAEAPIVLLYVRTAGNGDIDTLYDRSLYPFLHQMTSPFSTGTQGKRPRMKRNFRRVHRFWNPKLIQKDDSLSPTSLPG